MLFVLVDFLQLSNRIVLNFDCFQLSLCPLGNFERFNLFSSRQNSTFICTN